MLALTLVAALLAGPVGTSLAHCVSEGSGDHDPSPAPTEQVVAASHMHDCSGPKPAGELDPAVQPDLRRSLSLAVDLDLDTEDGPLVEPLRSTHPAPASRAPPRSRPPISSLRSVRTVVLLV
jgi:hypothetical protein